MVDGNSPTLCEAMDLTTVALAVGVISLLAYYFRKSIKPKDFPPGPSYVPILGSVPFLPRKVWKTAEIPIAEYLNDTYGDISGVYDPDRPVIVVSDPEVVRRLFKMEECSGRPGGKPFSKARYGQDDGKSRGLLMSEGDEWKEQRRFTMRSLKDLGFGKTSMEDSINHEVEKLVRLLQKDYVGKPMGLNNVMNLSIVNALWVLMVGETLELDDPKLLRIVGAIDQLIRRGNVTSKPLLKKLATFVGPWAIEKFDSLYKERDKVLSAIKNLVIPYIREHKQVNEGIESGNDHTDYIEDYLKEIKRNTNNLSSSFNGKRGEESLVISLVDLFLAGTETTTSSLMWAILFLLHHPKVQDQLHEELDKVLGEKETITYEERTRVPYTCAVINEIHRHSSIVRLALPHKITDDISVSGYRFPRGSVVQANLLRIHHDERYWTDPHIFNPERFYDRQKDVCVSNTNLMPFSVGKRYCLGQSLAEKELFMFFVGLIKAFKFQPSKEDGLPDCDHKSGSHKGTIRSAPFYKVILEKR